MSSKSGQGRTGVDWLVFVLSLAISVSAVLTLLAAMYVPTKPWFLAGFEIVTLVVGVFGVLIGLGRVREGVPLALVCVAGGVAAMSLFGYQGAGRAIVGLTSSPITLSGWLIARFAAAGMLIVCAGVVMIRRRLNVAVPVLAKGIGCLVALGVVGAGMWTIRGTITAWQLPGAVMAMGGLVLASVLIGLLAAGVHCTIRAFEMCAIDPVRQSV